MKTNYFEKKFLDEDLIMAHVRAETKKLLLMKETFIIIKSGVELVTNSTKEMLRFVCKNKTVKQYDLLEYLEFIKTLNVETCKWKTYKQLKVIKYHNANRILKPTSKFKIYLDEIKNKPMVQQYFREYKLERILTDGK